jgi:hypothetical protein
LNVIILLYLPGRPSITGVRHCGCKLWATPDGVNENNGACFATYPPERVSFGNSDRDSSGPRLVDDRAISLAKNWTSETEVQTKFLHLFGDFSQPAISRHMSGNSADISKRYF